MHVTPSTFPDSLVPLEDVDVSPGSGRTVTLHRFRAEFTPCLERPTIVLDRVYSARPLVLVDKQATFPELALLGLFKTAGWQGAWVDGQHRKYFDRMPNQSKGISLDTHVNQALTRIAENNGGNRAGCWDLVLWAERALAFVSVVPAEGAPSLGDARLQWLGAAIRSGFSAQQFAIVAWDKKRVVARRRQRRLP
jgi:hypothetical protein